MHKKLIVLHSAYWSGLLPGFIEQCRSRVVSETEVAFICTDDLSRDEIAEVAAAIEDKTPDGIVGMNDDSSLFSAMMSDKLNLPGPSLQSVVRGQNKYHARCLQAQSIADATPPFTLRSQLLAGTRSWQRFPAIVKPVKSHLSVDTYIVESQGELDRVLHLDSQTHSGAQNHLVAFAVDQGLLDPSVDSATDDALIEGYASGTQFTLDGYVFEGKCGFIGSTLSEFIDGTLSFSRFTFPCHFSPEATNKIHDRVEKYIVASGLDNAMFNAEFRFDLDTNQLTIIEVNTRIASQFIQLIYHVNGVSPVEHMILIALGQDPSQLNGGENRRYAMASSCVLRRKHDALVTRIPDQDDIAMVKQRYPDVQVVNFAKLNRNLSDIDQDSYTFRYAWVNISGNSKQEIDKQLAEIEGMLGYGFD